MLNHEIKVIEINTEYITLGQFLKYVGIIDQGNLAKDFIFNHKCFINDELTLMRGKKLYRGDKINIDNSMFFEISK